MQLDPISYISGGLLGDFIHQLSVINEKYIESGRKGILYIALTGDHFRFGLQKTYDDTYSFIISQPYIHSYMIHKGEKWDINLSCWRSNLSSLTPNENWYDLYKKTYNVEWGSHPWIYTNTILPDFKDKVLFHCSSTRFPAHINFNSLFDEFDVKNIIFITNNAEEYNYFKNRTGIDLNLHIITSLKEQLDLINSCKCFIGGLSSPLTFAHALHKSNITLIVPFSVDPLIYNLVKTFDKLVPNTRLIL
jgi:hypothetical protein